ncbi:PREDICTED: lipoyltransferase 1, mitochondrial-like [Ceratosolen solmsi marchali]|uniref:Lipoyltransferase 1, mitochondrial-like n=1 Tax=Ceratosolen solmsi marchali TaxID=326594 RepID=A0AAJ6YX12_9HYME|nr:PREDICTED: lipoyltransferase 1, mitochondrial-like [Ceratosolen solmsi marchali]
MSVIIRTSILGTKALRKFVECSPALRHTSNNSAKIDIHEDDIKKSVFISQSTNIYTNLALEDWFYRNFDFSKHHILLLWKSDPCVVIGRHQNPWTECNIPAIEPSQVVVARRNSGGGTVYHDFGNLNLSFFTPRQRYNRRYNLDIITRALFREWGLKSTINKKQDIIVQDEFKISGTAAKLGYPNAYHHCTLLVDVNTHALSLALKKTENGITTNATESIRSPIKNLNEVNSHITIDQLLAAVGWEYLRSKPLTAHDGGHKLIEQQRGFQMVNPTEDWFPGITKLIEQFQYWDWIYGKSPKFTVTRMLEAPNTKDANRLLKLVIDVEKGIVQDVKMTLPSDLNQYASVITNLSGKPYSHKLTNSIVQATGCKVVEFDVSVDKSNVAAL